jgi:hypothetical protein
MNKATKMILWWEGQVLAIVMGDAKQITEQIEEACRNNLGYPEFMVVEPNDLNIGKRDVVSLDTKYKYSEDGDWNEGMVELTEVLDYSPQRDTGWIETHYEISGAIYLEFEKDNPTGLVAERHAAQGTGGLYELAEELTDEFEEMNKDREWDGEYIEELYSFIQNKLYGTA